MLKIHRKKKVQKITEKSKIGQLNQHARSVFWIMVPPEFRVDPTHVVTLQFHFQIITDGHDHSTSSILTFSL